ncbi:ornithine cyclodeaminase family protein [Streptomyces sp. NPDC015346]|uniref:ornithine cyclodeaminase family protein n=1 Tax=Streptomyces sp. NPDC015346 TaxID=3364954 RepID=UPI0036FEB848
MPTLVLDHDAIADIIDGLGIDTLMDLTIENLEKALQLTSPTPEDLPPRAGFELRDPSRLGVFEWMPYRSADCITMKVVSYAPANPAGRGTPTILASIGGFDSVTGQLQVLCDGVFATALRTGAASAVASRLLSVADAATLGVIGAGAQAVAQVHALSRVRPLTTCLVYDTDPSAAQSLAARCPVSHIEFKYVPLPELTEQSDIVCTTTSVEPGGGPVFPDQALRPHIHVNAIGADLPGKTEVPLTLLQRALVVPDMIEQARREGECQQLDEKASPLVTDLPGLVRNAELYSQHCHTPTVFDSTGTALEDHVALSVLTQAAEVCGAGIYRRLQAVPDDALNPYSIRRPA